MDWFSRAFLRSSLVWLALAVTVGAAMAVYAPLAVYRTAHFHMALLGFVAMMIFGVAYHVVPRFTGHALHGRRLAGAHVVAANLGLALMAAGFACRIHGIAAAGAVLAIGGTLSALGAYLFVFNIWRTIDGPRTATPARAASVTAERRLPVADGAR